MRGSRGPGCRNISSIGRVRRHRRGAGAGSGAGDALRQGLDDLETLRREVSSKTRSDEAVSEAVRALESRLQTRFVSLRADDPAPERDESELEALRTQVRELKAARTLAKFGFGKKRKPTKAKEDAKTLGCLGREDPGRPGGAKVRKARRRGARAAALGGGGARGTSLAVTCAARAPRGAPAAGARGRPR